MTRRFAVLAALLGACGSPTKPGPAAPPPTTPVAVTPAVAHDADADPLPLWSDVTSGKLANGLQYYILPHHKPEKRVYMWLAVDAGSNLEDDDQRGLAHFDEHMAFNGTKHFPKADDVVNYIQSIGMRFGADLNAHTSWDETVYQLEVPSDKPEFVDKGFSILRDWAGDVTYDPKEVDKERGVVREEWRGNRGAGQRVFDKQSKILFHGSRYADRITIGDINTIDKAPRDALYRFYKDWYRPDLMAVIIVGEIDPAQAKAEIEKRFGDLKNPANERPRIHAEVPKADGTHVSIDTDHELTGTTISMVNLVPKQSRESARDDRRLLVDQVYAEITGERFEQLRRKPDAPFIAAATSMGPLGQIHEMDAFQGFAQAKDGHAEDALRALLTEIARVDRHGFTPGELERAKINIARGLEEAEATEATEPSHAYAEELVRHFMDKELVIGRAAEHALAMKYLPTVTVDELNKLAASYGGASNRTILISGPDGKPLITQDRVLKIVDEVAKSDIPAWDDKPAATTLIDAAPAPGKIASEKKLDKIGVTEWKLSNGARVIVKPTDFEADSVVLEGQSIGGEGMVSDKDYLDARFASEVVSVSGLGSLDADALEKALAGKSVRATGGIGETTEQVSARGSAKDIETMFQLVYLRMTGARKDDDAVKAWKTAASQQLANAVRSPEFQFQKRVADTLYNNNVRRTFPDPSAIDGFDAGKALAFYKDRFADASDFTFVIVGAVDLDKLRPLVETYLASLPTKKRTDVEKDLKIRKVPGVVKKEWRVGEAPKATVLLDFHGDETWTRDKDRDMHILGEVLSDRLRKDLREDRGGVYSWQASGSITRSPHQERSFVVEFTCDPDRVGELIAAVNDQIAKLQKEGADQGGLDKAKESFLRKRETEQRTNGYWAGWLASAYRYGDDPALVLDPSGMIARMTSDHVKEAANRYLDGKQLFQAVLLPEKK